MPNDSSTSLRETWLYPNRRAILFGCVIPMILIAAGIGLMAVLGSKNSLIWRWAAEICIVLGIALLAILLRQYWRPRIAFRAGNVLFYLRGGAPIAVPVDVVEAFFAGQSPAHLPIVQNQPQTVNLIARLSQRRTEWAERPVKPALGKWAEGYVTIRGTWCEPLGAETIRRLNRRLKEVKEAAKVTTNI